ncbi:MAG: hypothetical protein AAB661_01455, partial [Patescibacteria group bacterium]
MDFNFLNQKNLQNKGRKGEKPAKWSGSLAGAVLFFMLITALYLAVSGDTQMVPEVAISDLAKSVSAGEVKKIEVAGEGLTITYKNDEVKKAKKETGS